MEKEVFTFDVAAQIMPNGKAYTLLTANEPPYMNIQIVPLPDDRRDETLAKLYELKGERYVMFAEGRRDFCAIYAGGVKAGCKPMEVTQTNYKDCLALMDRCQQAAADFWAKHTENKNGSAL